MDEHVKLENLERDERTDRFAEGLDAGSESTPESDAAFTPRFPASGAKGWGSPS